MSGREPALIALTAVLTIAGTILVQYLTYRWGMSAQIDISDRQKRQQVFGQMMGRKFVTTQLYVSRFEAFIYSDYHEARWKLAGSPEESLDLQEAQRWMHKSEDLALELARNNQGLFETIGLIRVLFRPDAEMNRLTLRLYHFRTPAITRPPDALNAAQLESWKTKAVQQLQGLVESEYAKPIDDLITYLAAEINRVAK